MLEMMFEDSLKLAGQLRHGYPRSLGSKTNGWEEIMRKSVAEIPAFYSVICNNISGTRRDSKEQQLLDYVPGYRLIHITEFADEKRHLNRILSKAYPTDIVFPLLANYSSDYICYHSSLSKEGRICALLHDDGELIIMHESPRRFLETICEFYKQGVYFLDDDGYLDYDMDKESLIGSQVNPGVNYWL